MDAASTSLDEQLHAFRAAHPLRTVEVGSRTWTYADTAGSGTPLVLLPGLGGTAEAMFPIVRRLSSAARVLSLGHPRGVQTVAEAVQGIGAVMDAAGFSEAVLVGHSLGAALALSFARHSPDRVRALALANFGVYLPLRGRLLARTLRLLTNLPVAVRVRLVTGQLRRLVPAEAGRAFWSRYFGEVMEAQSRVLGDQFLLLGDLLHQPPFTREEFARWAGKVVLLESEEDSGFEPEEQSALRALHPRATVHVFAGAGHLSWVEQPDAFAGELGTLLGR